MRSAWLAGAAVGATGGLLALEFPTVGWAILALFAVPALASSARAAAISGQLVGFGAVWLALLGRVAVTCQAPDCQAPGMEPWLVLAGLSLTAGVTIGLASRPLGRGL